METTRVYKRTQIGEKQYELFANMGKTKRQVGTIQTTTTADVERTLSIYLREEFDKATIEVWTGIITPNLKKFERQFFSGVNLELGVQAINELYDQMCKVYNGSNEISVISERLVEVSKEVRDDKQKPLDATAK